MSGIQLLVLALVQGVTEFLPISSWGHLVLLKDFAAWPDHGPLIEIAVHVGTLGAVCLYFRRDLWWMVTGLARLGAAPPDPGARLLVLVATATVPVVVAGAALVQVDLLGLLRSAVVVGWTTLGFGVLLYAADRLNLTISRIDHMSVGHALFIGIAQVLALVPGTSRSGITMTAARMLGYERTEAARFSMLLSIPTIAAAGGLAAVELYRAGDAWLIGDALLAAAMAFVAALAAIGLLMAWLRRATFTPFVVYRVALGAGLLWWAYA